jgi:enoyl-CoA hydratase
VQHGPSAPEQAPLATPGLRSEQHAIDGGTVELLTIDRPHRLNAIDGAVLEALAVRLAAIARSPGVRAVIVTGSGDRAFCAGADVQGFDELDALGAAAIMARGQEVLAALETLPQPTIAAVNGYALGGGMEVALACDLRLAAASARFGQPEITLGHIPGWGATQRLPRIAGEATAKDLILSGRIVDAREAAELRLVHRVCDDDALLDEAVATAASLAAHPATALALAKRAIHAARDGGAAGYDVERQAVALCFTTAEQQAAIKRFVRRDGGGGG